MTIPSIQRDNPPSLTPLSPFGRLACRFAPLVASVAHRYVMELCDLNANGAIDRDELQPMIARWVQLAAERMEDSFSEKKSEGSGSPTGSRKGGGIIERSLSSVKTKMGGSGKNLNGTPRSESSASVLSAASVSDAAAPPKKPGAPQNASRTCVLL
jgi:hypothetical protein